jgi:urease accessory protein
MYVYMASQNVCETASGKRAKERQMARVFKLISATATAIAITTTIAQAHSGHGDAAGLLHGFAHPFSGLDHILAMIAVGIIASRLGGKALWLVPTTFVLVLALGGSLGSSGYHLPFAELGIAASVIGLGVMVALNASMPVAIAMGLVGFFAGFHGYAHGVEMPINSSGVVFAAGFMIATTLLHAIGILGGISVERLAANRSVRASQFTGGAMTLAGLGILTGNL